jgi:hypothetical protein
MDAADAQQEEYGRRIGGSDDGAKQQAAPAKKTDVRMTPTVARATAGAAESRKDWMDVPNPESKRMTASTSEPSI